MKIAPYRRCRGQAGFSLLELLIVVAILTVIMGEVFTQIVNVQKRFRAEDAKLDLTQEGREFLDTLVRDLRQVGYPNARMYASGVVDNTSPNNAVGFLNYSPRDVWFEGDVDGDGQVDIVRYTWQVGNGGVCPCRVVRSQIPKIPGAVPVNFAALDNILNSGGLAIVAGTTTFSSGGGLVTKSNNELYGAYTSEPLFRALDSAGSPVGATNDPTVLRTIRSIRITINLLAPPASELQSMIRPALSLTATARTNQ